MLLQPFSHASRQSPPPFVFKRDRQSRCWRYFSKMVRSQAPLEANAQPMSTGCSLTIATVTNGITPNIQVPYANFSKNALLAKPLMCIRELPCCCCRRRDGDHRKKPIENTLKLPMQMNTPIVTQGRQLPVALVVAVDCRPSAASEHES